MKAKALVDFRMFKENKDVKKGQVITITKQRFNELNKASEKFDVGLFLEEVKAEKKVKKETKKKTEKD